jgi:hypothetical protein
MLVLHRLMVLGSVTLAVSSCNALSEAPNTDRPIAPALASPAVASAPIAAKPPLPENSKSIIRDQTVADYFLQIPEQYLRSIRSRPVTQTMRQTVLTEAKQGKFGGIYDPDNGYLKTQAAGGGDLCGNFYVASFNRPNQSPIVAFTLACAAGDQLTLLDPDRDWADVTVQMLPDYQVEPFSTIELPRIGRTIAIVQEEANSKITKRYEFDGQRFIKR